MSFTNDDAKVLTASQSLLADCPASHLLTRQKKKRDAAGAWHDLTKSHNRSGEASKHATQAEQLLKNAVCRNKCTQPFAHLVAELKLHWATLKEAKQHEPEIQKANKLCNTSGGVMHVSVVATATPEMSSRCRQRSKPDCRGDDTRLPWDFHQHQAKGVSNQGITNKP